MFQLNNSMGLLKVLPKTNCGACNEATCLAFAAKVFNGIRQIGECPHLKTDIINQFDGSTTIRKPAEADQEEALEQLKRKINTIDLRVKAKRIGAYFSHGQLTIKILGKDFRIDSSGHLSSEIHIHPWIAIPILSYILKSEGKPVTGKWVAFRELKNGKTWEGLFGQRCEGPLKKVADTYPDLFEDMLHIFNGRQVENHYHSDISLVLTPLPRVPILICFWNPEEDLDSNLNLFFDSTAEDNLPIEAIYGLATGLVRMFEKIGLTHGVTEHG